MGQRLNLEITYDGKTLANSYYHWSAYTGSAYYLVEQAVNYIKVHADDFIDKKLLAVKALEATGAGMNDEDLSFAYAHQKWQGIKFKECFDRNAGILSILDKNIKSTQEFAEGSVSVDLSNLKDPAITFCIFDYWESTQLYMDEMCRDEESKREFIGNFVKTKYIDDTFTLSELKDVVDQVTSGKMLELTDGTLIGEI